MHIPDPSDDGAARRSLSDIQHTYTLSIEFIISHFAAVYRTGTREDH